MSAPVRSKETSDSMLLDDDDFELVEAPGSTTEYNQSGNGKRSSNDEAEGHSHDPFDDLLAATKAHAATLWTDHGPIFHSRLSSTDRDIVFNTFVAGLDTKYRQEMMCSTCRRFLRNYGDLCIVDDDGSLVPLLWPQDVDGVPEYCKQAVLDVSKLFKDKLVGEELKLSAMGAPRVLGKPVTGAWRHFSITIPLGSAVYKRSSDSQKTETSYDMLYTILEDYSIDTIARTHHLIYDHQLPYVSPHITTITYLRDVADKAKAADIKDMTKRRNYITRLAREAYVGCLSSLRSGMVGFLLNCVKEGQYFETLKQNWENKANPLSYLRPTAAPSAGNIEAAEAAFAKLGFTPDDLHRVFLTMDQVPKSAYLWSQVETKTDEAVPEKALPSDKVNVADKSAGGAKPIRLFDGLLKDLQPKPDRKVIKDSQIPCNNITFRRFVQRILPNAVSMEYQVNAQMWGYLFTTGRPGAKPIMSFHREGGHTASWYTYAAERECRDMSLIPGWVTVKSIISFPHMWDAFESAADPILDEEKAEKFKFKRMDIRYLFILDGAAEKKSDVGLCLFPSLMRPEFHEVRKTVEAFSDKGVIEQPQDKSAQQVAGIAVEKESSKQRYPIVRVRTTSGQDSKYKITLFE
ncbi:hypothetical protein F5884DRAFT_275708 [Xylogone sp. PMI_703]|nr:hypothetical protein F5884DRAFT_275708 [Xylogone sp. PMI_703]